MDSVRGRGLEIVTTPSLHLGAEDKQGGSWVAATLEDNVKTDLWLPRL